MINVTQIEPGIKVFDISREELKLNPAEIEKLLGYKDSVPEPVAEDIRSILAERELFEDIKAGYRILDNKDIYVAKGKVNISGMEFDVKNIISARLRKAETVVLFTATAGKRIGEYSKELMNTGEILRGYIADMIGSETVERAADLLEMELAEELAGREQQITNRYSPGYCGWDVAEQQKLFSFLPDKFCGIELTESSLMVPVKSVSGFIGAGKGVKKENYNCSACEVEQCIRRKTN